MSLKFSYEAPGLGPYSQRTAPSRAEYLISTRLGTAPKGKREEKFLIEMHVGVGNVPATESHPKALMSVERCATESCVLHAEDPPNEQPLYHAASGLPQRGAACMTCLEWAACATVGAVLRDWGAVSGETRIVAGLGVTCQ